MRGEEKSESMKVESYRDLLVWQKNAAALRKKACELESFEEFEVFLGLLE